jgi:hypothetical protein
MTLARRRRGRGQEGDRGPLSRSPKTACLQEKSLRWSGSTSFGGSDGLVCLFFCSSREVLPQGGVAYTITTSACLGVHDGDHGAFRRSPKTIDLQGKSGRVGGSVPFGGRNGLGLPHWSRNRRHRNPPTGPRRRHSSARAEPSLHPRGLGAPALCRSRPRAKRSSIWVERGPLRRASPLLPMRLGLLPEPEPFADLRHEAGHGATLRPFDRFANRSGAT